MTTKISVIMPVYNRDYKNYLKLAIESVLNQSFSDFEFIIINDASTDNTQEIIDQYKDIRIKSHTTTQNHGEYWATNFAVNLCQGEFLTWIHSDDIMSKDSLRLRYDALQNGTFDFVHGDIIKIDENGKEIGRLDSITWPKEEILSQYFTDPLQRKRIWIIHHTSVMMRWNFFYKAGPFDASLPFAGDIDWLIRAIKAGTFLYLPKVLYFYRFHNLARRVVDVKQGVNTDEIRDQIIRRYK